MSLQDAVDAPRWYSFPGTDPSLHALPLAYLWHNHVAPLELRAGQAKLVKKGSVLVLQVHYVTNGEPGKDRTSVGLIFSKAPVEKRVITAGAVQSNFAIPPGGPPTLH